MKCAHLYPDGSHCAQEALQGKLWCSTHNALYPAFTVPPPPPTYKVVKRLPQTANEGDEFLCDGLIYTWHDHLEPEPRKPRRWLPWVCLLVMLLIAPGPTFIIYIVLLPIMAFAVLARDGKGRAVQPYQPGPNSHHTPASLYDDVL